MGKKPKKYNIFIGDRFKDWEVISDIFMYNQTQHVKARCSCNLEKNIPIYKLLNPKSNFKCSKCSRIYNNKKRKNRGSKSIGDIGGVFINHIKNSAKKRNIEFNITNEQIWNLFKKQNYKCALSGIDLNLSRDIKNGHPDFSKFNASLDRINRDMGYIENNIQWIHRDINYMKNVFSDPYLIDMCKKIILNYEDKPDTIEVNVPNYKIENRTFTKIKSSAKRRKLEMNIDIEYLKNLLKKQSGKCKLSNISLSSDNMSLDRINSDFGYIENNLQWVHKDVNIMKFDFHIERFIFF